MATNNALNAPLPLSTSQGGTGVAAPTQYTVPIANGTGNFIFQALTNGQVLIGSTGAQPVAATITGTSGFVVTTGAGSISMTATSLTALTGPLQAPTFIGDASANKLLNFSYTASAVNYAQLANATAGNNPLLTMQGSDSNINFGIVAKGTGLTYFTNTTAAPPLAFSLFGNGFLSQFTNSGLSGNVLYTFPAYSGNVLLTNASLTNGQIPIGSTGSIPVAANITATGITVTNGAGSINLTPTQITSTLSYSSGNVAWALASNPWIYSTYTATTGNATLSAASGGVLGCFYTLVHIQAASGGPYTLTFNSNYKFPQGVVPIVSTGASSVDIFTFVWDGTYMRCVGIAQNIS